MGFHYFGNALVEFPFKDLRFSTNNSILRYSVVYISKDAAAKVVRNIITHFYRCSRVRAGSTPMSHKSLEKVIGRSISAGRVI